MEKVEFPKKIMIEATNCCNNKCFFCGSLVSDRARGFMNSELMYELIDKAYNYGAREISFHGMGEPFLCDDLDQYISAAKTKGYIYVYLDTNGILATPEKISKVLDAGLDSIKFSIHATTKETYQKVTGNDKFEQVLENLKYTSWYIKNNKLQCKLISYIAVSTINQQEKDDFEKLMQPYVDEVWIYPIHNGSGVMKTNSKYSTTELMCQTANYNRV